MWNPISLQIYSPHQIENNKSKQSKRKRYFRWVHPQWKMGSTLMIHSTQIQISRTWPRFMLGRLWILRQGQVLRISNRRWIRSYRSLESIILIWRSLREHWGLMGKELSRVFLLHRRGEHQIWGILKLILIHKVMNHTKIQLKSSKTYPKPSFLS